jgi:chemotaxis protein methyltransferase CheR
LQEVKKQKRSLRIWSVGCSTGCEPYTIAFVAYSILGKDYDFKILATDLDTNVLDFATAGVYDLEVLDKIPSIYHQYLEIGEHNFVIKPFIKELVHYKQLNLLENWPMAKEFDVLFCRNVFIYFNKETQKDLYEKFADKLSKDGLLYVGHCENISNLTDRYEACSRTIYRKVK